MKIIQDVLTKCGYREEPGFSFSYRWNQTESECRVIPFVSRSPSHEAYLLVPISGQELPHLLEGNYLPKLMCSLGQQEFYSPDLDRNTTLLLLCQRNDSEEIDHNARVQIEDDPYYFKKYVFAYTEKEETAALDYVKEHLGQDSLTDMIRSCLLDTNRFALFKEHATGGKTPPAEAGKKGKKGKKKTDANRENIDEAVSQSTAHLAYGFFAELATKITVLPIRPTSDKKIRSVEEYWQDVRAQMPAFHLAALEHVLDLDADDVDGVLAKWNDLTRAEQE